MKLFAPVIVMALAVSACSGTDSAESGTSEKAVTNISIADDEGDVVFSAGGGNGVNVKLPGFSMNVDVPGIDINAGEFDIDGVNLYPGSTIESLRVGGKVDGGNEPGVNVTFSAPATPQVVSAYFRDAFKAQGITLTSGNNALAGQSKDGDPFQITLAANGPATKGTIVFVSNDSQ